ncbi:MAG: hypothetical protein R2724_07700 [Bryobacterales bacterium]
MKVSDEVWVATALLHREQPSRSSFEPAEIRARAQALHPTQPLRAGINPHIYLHCVANLPPNTATYRMLFRLEDKTLRLYRRGDPSNPGRLTGRVKPLEKDLPLEHRPLLGWYDKEFDERVTQAQADVEDDPILGFIGLGKEVWQGLGGGDAILRWLRSDDPNARPPWTDNSASASTAWSPSATATFWENVRELRNRGLLPRRWRVADLKPLLSSVYSSNTINTVPANSAVASDGSEPGDYVRKGGRPEVVRVDRGLYELIDDPERQAA